MKVWSFIKPCFSSVKVCLALKIRKPNPKLCKEDLDLAKKDLTKFLLLNLAILSPTSTYSN